MKDARERAPRREFRHYLGGLLGESERKNVSQMARDAVEVTYHKLHHFLTEATWSAQKINELRDVTQGEDRSRIRTKPLPQFMAIARNLALNLYRDAGFNNMVQAERKCKYGLDRILNIFRMK